MSQDKQKANQKHISMELTADGARVTNLSLHGSRLILTIEAELADSELRASDATGADAIAAAFRPRAAVDDPHKDTDFLSRPSSVGAPSLGKASPANTGPGPLSMGSENLPPAPAAAFEPSVPKSMAIPPEQITQSMDYSGMGIGLAPGPAPVMEPVLEPDSGLTASDTQPLTFDQAFREPLEADFSAAPSVPPMEPVRELTETWDESVPERAPSLRFDDPGAAPSAPDTGFSAAPAPVEPAPVPAPAPDATLPLPGLGFADAPVQAAPAPMLTPEPDATLPLPGLGFADAPAQAAPAPMLTPEPDATLPLPGLGFADASAPAAPAPVLTPAPDAALPLPGLGFADAPAQAAPAPVLTPAPDAALPMPGLGFADAPAQAPAPRTSESARREIKLGDDPFAPAPGFATPGAPPAAPAPIAELRLGDDDSLAPAGQWGGGAPAAEAPPAPMMENWEHGSLRLGDTPPPFGGTPGPLAMSEDSSAVGGARHGEPLPAISFGSDPIALEPTPAPLVSEPAPVPHEQAPAFDFAAPAPAMQPGAPATPIGFDNPPLLDPIVAGSMLAEEAPTQMAMRPQETPPPPRQPEPRPEPAKTGESGRMGGGDKGKAEGGTTVLIRYTCPKCKTQGMQAVDKVGTVVNCSNCGKAMRLVMKK